MMKHEFENIAGYEVSWDDYDKIIEPMYSATNLSKEEFVKTLNKKRFALTPLKTLVKRMQKEAEHLKETCTHYTDYESKEKLDDIVKEYINRKYGERCHYIMNAEDRLSCSYPCSVTIYDSVTYNTVDVIMLTK